MKALKMAVALAFAAVSPVIAPTSASANVAAEEEVDGGGGHYMCYYRYSFISNGTQYNVYQCYPIYA
jgi:hypothetical protein